jgi:hypothetical protein
MSALSHSLLALSELDATITALEAEVEIIRSGAKNVDLQSYLTPPILHVNSLLAFPAAPELVEAQSSDDSCGEDCDVGEMEGDISPDDKIRKKEDEADADAEEEDEDADESVTDDDSSNNGDGSGDNNEATRRSQKRGRSSVSQRRPGNSKFSEDIMDIWRTINSHKYAVIFRKPVNLKDAPGYSKIVKEPVDLGLIKQRICDGDIHSLEELSRQTELMCDNAMKFNGEGDDYYEYAKELKAFALTTLAEAREGREDGAGTAGRRRTRAALSAVSKGSRSAAAGSKARRSSGRQSMDGDDDDDDDDDDNDDNNNSERSEADDQGRRKRVSTPRTSTRSASKRTRKH